MYINGAVEDMERFQRSFGHNLSRVLDSIEQNNNMRLYLIKIPEIRPLKDSEMSSIIEEATSNVKKI